MKKGNMDYQKIIDVCKVIGLIIVVVSAIVSIIGGWAYFKNKEINKINEERKEKREIKNESSIEANKEKITNLEKRLESFVQEQRQVSSNYSELSKEEQDSIFRENVKEKFGISSEEINNQIEKATKKTESFITQAMGYELQGNNPLAIEYYKKALDETVYDKDKAWILFSIGNLYFDNKNYDEAKDKYTESLNNYKNLESKSDESFTVIGYAYNNLGIIERDANNFLKAIENHKDALKIRKELVLRDHDTYILEVSMSYNNLAVIYKKQGKLDLAIDYNEKAIEIRKELAFKSNQVINKYFVARSLSNLGNVYSDKENYPKAKENIEEAIRLLLTLKGRIGKVLYEENLAAFYSNLGRVLHSLKDYKSSIEPLRLAIIYYKSLKGINEEKYIEPYVGAVLNLARTYRDTNKLDESIIMFERALEIQTEIFNNRKSSGDSEIHLADIYYNIGVFYFEKRSDKELSLYNFNKAHNIYKKYPQSARAKKWAEGASERINYLKRN